MKKHLLMALVLAGIFTLSACGPAQPEPNPLGAPPLPGEIKMKEEKIQNPEPVAEKKEPPAMTLPDDQEVTFSAAKKLDTNVMLKKYEKDMIATKEMGDITTSSEDWKNVTQLFSFYEIGTIKKSPYKDWRLVVLQVSCDGPCFNAYLYRLAWNREQDKLVFFSKISEKPEGYGISALVKNKDDSFTLASLTSPQTISLPEKKGVLVLEQRDRSFIAPGNDPHDSGQGAIAFKDPVWGNVYLSTFDSGCVSIRLADGSVQEYAYHPKFFDEEDHKTISWSDGAKTSSLSNDYKFFGGSCGVMGNCYLIKQVDENELVTIGKVEDGSQLYAVKSPQEKKPNTNPETPQPSTGKPTPPSANDFLNEIFEGYNSSLQYDPEKKPELSFKDYLGRKPLLFWKDPLGRFVPIVKAGLQPPAECGKPVIYLYPEKTMDVPDYGQGWIVTAAPDGTLTNHADGLQYHYLYWEGKSKKSISADQGFVVEKNKVQSFLDSSMTSLGLNDREKNDFMEFWLPRIEKNPEPYFFISFLGTKDFNTIAPLDIAPSPETLIRIFMYYRPLLAKIEVAPETLKSIPRRGFTVIEWGGTSSAAWNY